jgi:hypothetical protein
MALRRLSEIQDKSLAKSLHDIVTLVDAVLTEEEVERVNRFINRMAQLGHTHVASKLLRCKKAELAHTIKAEADFTLFYSPAGKKYKDWTEFRPVLAQALTIAPSTLSDYISLVRFGREVLGMQEGDFVRYDGLTTVRHVRELCEGVDGRSSEDFGRTVRPKTVKFAERLAKDFPSEDGVAGSLRRYYHEEQIFHDLTNPDAINRPIGELGDKAREELGAPKIIPRHAYVGDKICGYVIRVIYPDTDDAIGLEEDFVLNFVDEFVPTVVREQIDHRLGIRGE